MMPASGIRRAAAVALLLLSMQLPLGAQVPGARRTVSAVGQHGLGDTLARMGRVRYLVCRGRPGVELRAEQGASPRDARFVTMTLRYDRSSQAPGLDYRNLTPGACTWNPGGHEGVPAEPGVVYFDLPREAQPWSAAGERQLDTTISAAENFPDVRSVTRYLGDPAHYWVFYVDDVNNLSVSFGAYVTERRAPTLTTLRGRYDPATTRTPGTAEAAVGKLVRAPLTLVSVSTVLDRFSIEFTARAGASPTVRYSTERPFRAHGTTQWTFPGGVVQGSGAVEGGFAAEVAGGAADGFRATYIAWSRIAPERGKLYHYIITVPATPYQPAQQHVGRLTTVGQYARVVFTGYHLIDAWTYTEFDLFAHEGAPIELRPAEGEYRLTGISKDVANAPDQLRISVHADSWTGDPNRLVDQASAKTVLAIGISPLERYVRIPFRMRSDPGSVYQSSTVSTPKPPSALVFEIEGYVEVTRR